MSAVRFTVAGSALEKVHGLRTNVNAATEAKSRGCVAAYRQEQRNSRKLAFSFSRVNLGTS